ncbi:MAG: histidine phosphatase family protein [Deltaproteobacteria bacterium]|nr:histidine phosphatase family protein [Deltaproteobacteria bacterium]
MQTETTSTRIYLIRHGQVVGHDEYRYNGHSDVDITDEGVLQLQRMADFLADKDITAVYSSDLKRSIKGATMIAEALGLGEDFERCDALRELHLGRWEGLTRMEATELFPEEADFGFKDLATDKLKGGESLVDLRARVLPAIADLVARHRGEHICIVAHGGVNRVILCEAMGLPLENFFRIEQDYGGLNLIDYLGDDVMVVKMLNGGPNQIMGATKIY